MPPKLSGKVCVITGTGGSIGRAAALAFAREGASVVGCDLNVDSAEATVRMARREGGTMESSPTTSGTAIVGKKSTWSSTSRARRGPTSRAVTASSSTPHP